jgi:hypothetical protein
MTLFKFNLRFSRAQLSPFHHHHQRSSRPSGNKNGPGSDHHLWRIKTQGEWTQGPAGLMDRPREPTTNRATTATNDNGGDRYSKRRRQRLQQRRLRRQGQWRPLRFFLFLYVYDTNYILTATMGSGWRGTGSTSAATDDDDDDDRR